MRSKFQEQVLRVLYKALKPLVHLLLEIGIGHREFSEVAKRAYVDVATEKYGIRGRKTNISRVAVMTGLTRKEVKRVRDRDGSEVDDSSAVKPIPPSQVLQNWHTDPDYLDESGAPRSLPFADAEHSFSSLVKKYAGDIPPGAIRTELVRSGAVEISRSGKLEVARRYFRVVDNEKLVLWFFDRFVFGVSEAMVYNYTLNKSSSGLGGDTWPMRVAEAMKVRPDDARLLREHVRECTRRFTEEVDKEIVKYEVANPNEHAENDFVNVFVGACYFEEPVGRMG